MPLRGTETRVRPARITVAKRLSEEEIEAEGRVVLIIRQKQLIRINR